MDMTEVPSEFRWMVPVVEELAPQYESDQDTFTLSNSGRALIMNNLTPESEYRLRVWDHEGQSKCSGDFMTAMMLLDELGVLDEILPPPSYDTWKADLASEIWGEQRGGVQMIVREHLAELGAEEKMNLFGIADQLLLSGANPNAMIWLSWLKCQIDPSLDLNRKHLREIVSRISTPDDEKYDLKTDACSALLTLPHLSAEDISCVEQFAFGKNVDEYDAAVALEDLLASQYVSVEVKKRLIATARSSGVEELVEVADEFG